MVERRLVDSGEPPAPRSQARAKVELFSAMEISISQISNRFNRGPPVDAATIQSRHVSGAPVGVVSPGALDVLEIAFFTFNDHAAGPGKGLVGFKRRDRG